MNASWDPAAVPSTGASGYTGDERPAPAGGPLQVVLNTNALQTAQLRRLQVEFAAACNLVAPIAQANRCWNRVALHHLAYRELRARFPQLGSQMACNAVYSVARTYRVLLQHPQSPWNLDRRPGQPLPCLRFQVGAPVYFDRHTLSLKGNLISMFSLDGRLRFELNLKPEEAARFAGEKLREIVLIGTGHGFLLQFWFEEKALLPAASGELEGELPEYLIVTPAEVPADALTEAPVEDIAAVAASPPVAAAAVG